MVIQPAGLRCRCGHQGCLEAYAALPALADLLGVTEAQLLSAGDHIFESNALTPATRPRLEEMLRMIGIALGNAINIDPVSNVVIAGWPSLLAPPLRDKLAEGLDASVLGGMRRRGVSLRFIPPSIGSDPMPTLCYSAYAWVQRGAMDATGRKGAESPGGQPAGAEP